MGNTSWFIILLFLLLAGCSKKEQPIPTVAISRDVDTVMVDDFVNFYADVTNAAYYVWEYGDERLMDNPSIKHRFREGGVKQAIKLRAYYYKEKTLSFVEAVDTVRVYIPGCTDPDAFNYNPKADYSTGCSYLSGPPNVFFYYLPRPINYANCDEPKEVNIKVFGAQRNWQGLLNGSNSKAECASANNCLGLFLPSGKYTLVATDESGKCNKKQFEFFVTSQSGCQKISINFYR